MQNIETAKAAIVKSLNAETYIQVSDLRNALDTIADFNYKVVDAALLDLMQAGAIDLEPESNRKSLTAANKEYAVLVAGIPNHIVKLAL